MLEISDPDLLSKLDFHPPIEAFHYPNKQEFDDLRSVLTNEVIEFEGLRAVPSTGIREGPGPKPRTP
jgi:hypothetical protein